ncbi:MAG: hypothetical protein ABF479_19370 [Gluconacetobacter sp.]
MTDVTGLPDVWDGAGDDGDYPLLKYQRDANDAIRNYDVLVWEKSRRIGASWGVSWLAALVGGSAAQAGGMDVYYMGFEKDMTRQFVSDTGDHAKLIEIAAGDLQESVFNDPDKPDADLKVFRIDFGSGHEVLGLPSVARAFRSKQGLVIIDEAAFIDDLKAVLKAAFALLIWGGKIVIISSHNGESNPFNELCQEIRAGRHPDYHLLRTTFDDALADGLYRRICQKLGREWSAEAEAAWRAKIIRQYGAGADEELFCIPNPTTGAFLPLVLIEARQDRSVPVVRWEREGAFSLLSERLRQAETAYFCRDHLVPLLDGLDPKTPYAFGMDFARKRDLSVIWIVAIGRDLVRRTVLVIELANIPFEQQKQILWFVLDRLPRFRAGKMDATGNGAWLAEVTMQKYGSRVEPVMLHENWYREHSPIMKAAFQDGTVTIPADRDIQDDLRCMALVRGVGRVPENAKTGEMGNRHGDGAIALLLAIAASRAEPEEYGYRAAPGPFAADRAAEGAPTGWEIEQEIAQDRAGRHGGMDAYGIRGMLQ